MTFAWQGFQFGHPDDWAPSLITGNRDEGYVRLASPEALSYQVRWKRLRTADHRRSLDDYLSKLKRDAGKLKVKFQSTVQQDGDSLVYRWTGAGNGRGRLATRGERTFFLEASSTSNRSAQGAFQELDSSFLAEHEDHELWSLFGLAVRLRSGLAVERHLFQSGRTRVEWKDRLGRIVAERWGFGEQILEKHSFEDWAKQSMGMERAKVETSGRGLALALSRPLLKTFGLATFDADRNQLVTVKTLSRGLRGRPEWDWLT